MGENYVGKYWGMVPLEKPTGTTGTNRNNRNAGIPREFLNSCKFLWGICVTPVNFGDRNNRNKTGTTGTYRNHVFLVI